MLWANKVLEKMAEIIQNNEILSGPNQLLQNIVSISAHEFLVTLHCPFVLFLYEQSRESSIIQYVSAQWSHRGAYAACDPSRSIVSDYRDGHSNSWLLSYTTPI